MQIRFSEFLKYFQRMIKNLCVLKKNMENQFLVNQNFNISNQTVKAICPSNIALIKYWGKYANQIPANPSISYTLNHCNTQTSMEFFADEQIGRAHV